jgi:hypothetical protein
VVFGRLVPKSPKQVSNPVSTETEKPGKPGKPEFFKTEKLVLIKGVETLPNTSDDKICFPETFHRNIAVTFRIM